MKSMCPLIDYQSLQENKNILEEDMKGIQYITLLSSIVMFCGCNNTKLSIEEIDNRPILNVCVIAGQSNAVGNGYICDLTEQQKKDYPTILYYGFGDVADGGKVSYVSSKEGKGNGTSKDFFGMEVGMAQYFETLQTTEEHYGIIKCAYNGSSIVKDADTNRGDWNVYDDLGNGENAFHLIDTIHQATACFEEMGYKVRLMGCAWMQGEADYETCTDYHSRMKALMNYIRSNTGYESLPFALGELAKQNYPDKSKPFYVSLEFLKKKGEGLVDIVRISELKPRCTIEEAGKGNYGPWDFVHWSGEEMLQIGTLFAKSIVAMDNEVKKTQ